MAEKKQGVLSIMATTKVAFIGLGVMGYPMAGHLQKNGYDVTVYNRTEAKGKKWARQFKGASQPTPKLAARGADFVCMCVGNDDDLRSVVNGKDGVLAGMKKGAILIDHTTASANVAREIAAAAAAKGIDFLDAPVSGGQAGAENAALTVMCGGKRTAFTKAKPVMDSYGKAVTLMGTSGAGQLTKMVNQICIAGIVQGLSEGINFALASGLDAKKVIDVISKGAAQSWQMENRAETMIDDFFDYGFAVDWMRKDLGICMDEARNNGAALPLTALVDQFYHDVQQMGGGRWDTSSLIRRIRTTPVKKKRGPKAGAKRKAPAKRTVAKKTTAKTTTARKTAAKPAARKTTASKTTTTKTAAKPAARKTTTAKKAPARKASAKPVARKTTPVKKAPAKKAPAKRATVAKKPAVRKAAPAKKAPARRGRPPKAT